MDELIEAALRRHAEVPEVPTMERIMGHVPSRVWFAHSFVAHVGTIGRGGGNYNLTFKQGEVAVAAGVHAAPDLAMHAKHETFARLCSGELDPQRMVDQGELKVAGAMWAVPLLMGILFERRDEKGELEDETDGG